MKTFRVTRREFFTLAGVAAGGCALAACGSSGGANQAAATSKTARFKSEPNLNPPVVKVSGTTTTTADGLVFVTPGGPLILDATGEPVWYSPVKTGATMDLQVQTYQGKPVITWWQGKIQYGVGKTGEVMMLDTSYREVMRVKAGNGLQADLHEFKIAPDGTGYLTAYQEITADLSAVGGPPNGKMMDAYIQGIDLATGKVVFQWKASDHITLAESYRPYSSSSSTPYTPFHVNSIDPMPDGNLLVSARHTWTLYKIDRSTGTILWHMGGKENDFKLGSGVHYAWQHDARWNPGNVVTIFDNESPPPEATQSRGLVLQVTETKLTATLVHAYDYPGEELLCGSQGSVQILPSSDVFVGWGAQPYFTQYRKDGKVVLRGSIETGKSYRAFRVPWTGTPTHAPSVAVEQGSGGDLKVYTSWNGATEVDRWKVLGGSARDSLSELGSARRSGFETTISVSAPSSVRYLAARAVDAKGNVLGTSSVTKV